MLPNLGGDTASIDNATTEGFREGSLSDEL